MFFLIFHRVGPHIVIIHFRASEDEEEGVKYADCLCGQKKNFAQVMFLPRYQPAMEIKKCLRKKT